MTAVTAAVPPTTRTDASLVRLVLLGVAVAGVGLAVLAATGTLATTTSGGGHFDHTADYWYTASGLPIAVGAIGTLLGVHWLQRGSDGRLGTVGAWVGVLALGELFVQLLASVLTSIEQQWGPAYVLCTALAFVGHAVLAAGSWRTGLLPRWVLGVWPLAFVLGSFAAWGPMPLLLIAFYVVLGVLVSKRVTSRGPTVTH
jgi:hypothetical protein